MQKYTEAKSIGILFGITKKGNPTQCPVIRVLIGLQDHGGNERQVRPTRLLVDRALVQPGIGCSCAIYSVDMDNWH